MKLIHVRSDHGGEFTGDFEDLCEKEGFNHNFSVARTPQQNGVVERKNITLQEMARTMLLESGLPKQFWVEAVNCACWIINRSYHKPKLLKTPYELFTNKLPTLDYFRVFGCRCYILNTKDQLDKFDQKADEGVLVGYSSNMKAYRIWNKRNQTVEESCHVKFDELGIQEEQLESENDEAKEQNPEVIDEENKRIPKSFKYKKDHPKEQIVGDQEAGVQTRRKKMTRKETDQRTEDMEKFAESAFVSMVEP